MVYRTNQSNDNNEPKIDNSWWHRYIASCDWKPIYNMCDVADKRLYAEEFYALVKWFECSKCHKRIRNPWSSGETHDFGLSEIFKFWNLLDKEHEELLEKGVLRSLRYD